MGVHDRAESKKAAGRAEHVVDGTSSASSQWMLCGAVWFGEVI
jgi:hypothetical protein